MLVSTAGGGFPSWRGDGRELFYLAPDMRMMAVAVKSAEGGVELGIPQQLFDVRGIPDVFNASANPGGAKSPIPYAVSPDSQRFLVMGTSASMDTATEEPLTVVTNWQQSIGIK